MSRGFPALVSAASCLTEICGDAALSCDPRDPDEIARKLHDLCSDTALRAELRERGFSFPQTTDINNWYLGFNWLDPVIGKGDTPEQQVKNRKLRQALSVITSYSIHYTKLYECC